MGEDYMIMSEIMSNMGFKHRTSFRENYFLLALKDGAIEPLYVANTWKGTRNNI